LAAYEARERKNILALLVLVIVLVPFKKKAHNFSNKNKTDTGNESVYSKKAEFPFKAEICVPMNKYIKQQ
jgi:hypothetical protein